MILTCLKGTEMSYPKPKQNSPQPTPLSRTSWRQWLINFSHTGNAPTHQPYPKQTPLLSNTTSTSHWVKSNNPMVIKPLPDTSTKPKANPHQLILLNSTLQSQNL